MSQAALELALTALARKERTVSELRALMEGRGVGEAEVEEVIEQLLADGTLDDARFARRFAEDKRQLAGWGSQRIVEALRARGVRSAELELAAAERGEDELERAVELLRARRAGLGSDAERQRALTLLVRRGYELELAYDAVRRVEAEAA